MSKILKALNVEDITGYYEFSINKFKGKNSGVISPFLSHDFFYSKPHNTKPLPFTLERVYCPDDKRWRKKVIMHGEALYTCSKKILE